MQAIDHVRGADPALVRRAQRGEDEARSRLFELWLPRLLRIVRARLGHRLRRHLDSSDIQQDAAVAALRYLDRLDPRSTREIAGWLATLVENRIRAADARARTRKRDARRSVPLDDVALELVARDRATPDALGDREECALLAESLSELDEGARALVRLRSETEHSWGEIAAAVGRPSGDAARVAFDRVRSRLCRRRARTRG